MMMTTEKMEKTNVMAAVYFKGTRKNELFKKNETDEGALQIKNEVIEFLRKHGFEVDNIDFEDRISKVEDFAENQFIAKYIIFIDEDEILTRDEFIERIMTSQEYERYLSEVGVILPIRFDDKKGC